MISHRSFIFLVLGITLFGCSSFDQRWRKAPLVHASDPFSGHWDGRWSSAKHHGAGGRLRCLLSRVDDQRYRAEFKANWMAFTSHYDVLLQAQQRGGELHFQGSHRLPAIFGGEYQYKGHATPRRFTARYESSYDHGVFELKRVAW